MVRGFSRLRTPFFRVAPDDLNRHIIAADLHLGDAGEALKSLRLHQLIPDDKRRFHRRLGVILHWVMFDVGVQDHEVTAFLATKQGEIQRSGY